MDEIAGEWAGPCSSLWRFNNHRVRRGLHSSTSSAAPYPLCDAFDVVEWPDRPLRRVATAARNVVKGALRRVLLFRLDRLRQLKTALRFGVDEGGS